MIVFTEATVLKITEATVGHAGSPTRTVYVDVTLIRSKVKVKVTEHLNIARGSLKYRTQSRHFGTIAQLRRAISSQIRHVSTIGKKLVKQQYLLYMSL